MNFVIECLKIAFEVGIVMFLLLIVAIMVGIVLVKLSKDTDQDDSEIDDEHLKLKNVTEAYKKLKKHMQHKVLSKEELKKLEDEEKQLEKETKKDQKNKGSMESYEKKPRTFVLTFKGDVEATQAKTLAEQITAVLSIATVEDEIILKLTSPGGMVHSYGYAASQLVRIRQKGVKLTVCVDQIAASGGYMMACIADRIIAAPFAVLGSIGVVAEFPNFNRLMKKFDIDYEQETAGEYKRTLTMLGDNTDPKAREKFKQELEECHTLFKNHVSKYRKQIDVEAIATGEHWYGTDALTKKLVDEIATSEDYILGKIDNSDVFKFEEEKPKKSLLEKIISSFKESVVKSFTHIMVR